jgi:hypothetical protein
MKKQNLMGLGKVLIGLVFGLVAAAASADEIPKSGKVSFNSGWKLTGTLVKLTDTRSYWSGLDWGVWFNVRGTGFMHRASVICPDVGDIENGVINAKGFCTLTDSDGDKIFGDWSGKQPSPTAEFAGLGQLIGGTGKFTGIQGKWEFYCRFANPAEGQVYCRQELEYRLP